MVKTTCSRAFAFSRLRNFPALGVKSRDLLHATNPHTQAPTYFSLRARSAILNATMSQSASPIGRLPADDSEYNDIHRAFLQAFQTHGVLTTDKMKEILAHVMTASNPSRPWTPADITAPHLTSTLQLINAKLEAFDYEIRSTRDQESKTPIYAFVNNTSDALTQFATTFSANEMGYIRRLLDAMFETNNTSVRETMAVRHTEASQLARVSRRSRQSQVHNNGDEEDTEATQQAAAETSISISDADAVLESLVAQRFFQKSRAGYYTLAPRALIELRAYLKETYNEVLDDDDEDGGQGREITRIRDCEGCREIVTIGLRCDNRECGVRWHDACAKAYYSGGRRRRGGSVQEKKCPRCERLFTESVFVGERAERVGGSRRSLVVGREEDGDEDEDEEMEEDE